MREIETTSTTPAEVASLFPLPEPSRPYFIQVGNLSLGWVAKTGKHNGQFQLQRLGTFRGWTVLETWPLTEQGWQSACELIREAHPDLFEKICDAARQQADRTAALERSAEFGSMRQAQGSLGTLGDCILLGGYGLQAGISAGSKVDLHFTQQEIWLTKATGHVPYLRCSYKAARALEFEGGVVRTGGGFVGGGFGVLGAAEGIAMAKLLNSLTSRSTVHTAVRLEAEDAEIFLFTAQASPKALLMQFAEARAKIKAANGPLAQTPDGDPDDLTQQLARLGDLFERGLLTADEFAAAKSRLLG